MKNQFSTLAGFVIFGVMMSVAQAEHSNTELQLSDSVNKRLQEYLDLSDLFASLNTTIFNNKTDEEIIKITRNKVTKDFKDPDSSKFRSEKVFRTKVYPKHKETGETMEKDGIYVCGEVNGKNSYGAYVGYQNYWGGFFVTALENEDNDLALYAMLHYCYRDPIIE